MNVFSRNEVWIDYTVRLERFYLRAWKKSGIFLSPIVLTLGAIIMQCKPESVRPKVPEQESYTEIFKILWNSRISVMSESMPSLLRLLSDIVCLVGSFEIILKSVVKPQIVKQLNQSQKN